MKDKQKPDLKEEKINIQFKCPIAIRDKLKRIAAEEDRTLGGQITRALRMWLYTYHPGKADVRGQ